MKLDMTFHQTDQSFAAEFERLQVVSSVISVNGKTGAVQLTAEDVGAIAQGDVQSGTIICTAFDKIMKAEDSAEYALKGLTLYGKTTQNGTPAPDAPIVLESTGVSGSIAVKVLGRNLIDAAAFGTNSSISQYIDEHGNKKYKVTRNGDVFTVKFDSKGLYVNSRLKPVWFNPGTYTFTMFSDSSFMINLGFYKINTDGSLGTSIGSVGVSSNTPHTFTRREPFILTIGGNDKGYGTYSFCLQLEAGTTATEYEAYKEQQVLTAQTPNGLPGIPVTNGGSYTDENGQQWICDEIDFARGVYVQRIGKLNSYTGEAVGDTFLSTTGELSRGATVLYPLVETVETALTEEELAQYTALHTYYPVTTVLNDGGAQMKLGYVADTKNYIDNRFTQLQNAILSLGGNV